MYDKFNYNSSINSLKYKHESFDKYKALEYFLI
jgi:hypothetical protein